jgi:hypothetical protein
MKKYLLIPLCILLLSGCATIDLQNIWTSIQAYIESYQTSLPDPVVPIPTPIPEPVPIPIPPPEPVTDTIIICDLEKIPDMMRGAGITGRDGILYYGLAVAWAQRRGWSLVNEEIIAIYNQRDAIYSWFESYISGVEKRFKAEPGLKGIIVLNDAKDRMGLDMGPAIMERLRAYEDRLEMGAIVPESEY